MKQIGEWLMRWRFAGVVLLVVLAAMAVSLAIGLQQSVWFDEAYSITLAKQSVAGLIHATSLDTHPPLYYMTLKAWAGLFGWSEVALRSLSVLMFGGAVSLAVVTMRRYLGTRAAIGALVLMALSPFLLRYGFEIRMYSMALFIGVAATAVLLRAVTAPDQYRWWWYGAYSALVATGVYTLYYLALVWAAHAVWLMWRAWHKTRSMRAVVRQPWLLAYAASVALFLPWLGVLVHQLGNGALTSVARQLTIENMVGLISFWFLYTPPYELNGVTSLVVLAVIVAIVVIVRRGFAAATVSERRLMLLLGLYTLVPTALIALVCLVKPMYLERYLSFAMIGLLLLLAACVSILTKRGWRPAYWLLAGLVAVSLYGTVRLTDAGNYNYQRLDRPDGKKAAAILRPVCHDKTIIFNGPYLALDESYYFEGCPVYVLSTSDFPSFGGFSVLRGMAPRLTRIKAMDGHDTAIYIHYNDDYAQPSDPSLVLRDSTYIDKLVIDTYATKR